MKAVIQTRYGAPEVLQLTEVPTPIPGDQEVLIRVHATTANAADSAMRTGRPLIGRLYTGLIRPKRPIPGVECSGEVAAVGKAVQGFQVGDQVFGETLALGCYAEYVCIPANGLLMHKPATLPHEAAAAVCAGGITALNFLRQGKLQRGQKVLIYGASGSVGTFAVQIAAALGTEVTAVCGTRNLALMQQLGATTVVDYSQQDFTQTTQRYDLIFDAVGKTTFARCRGLLVPGGTFMAVDLSLSLIWQMIRGAMFGGKKVILSATGALPVQKRLELLRELHPLLAAGTLQTVIDSTYTLADAAAAHSRVDTGRKTGNVILTVHFRD